MIQLESYTDYPKQATENAKIALRYAEENGWGSCGTPVGKKRANQLANRQPITRDTIARMAAFERHRQNSKKKLGDGCGRLMWLAWGGDAGIKWAQKKLKQIDKQNLKMTTYQRILTKLYYTPKKKRKLEEIPQMDFLFIESPKGVYHYPLFKTEVEAEYFDEVVNAVETGSSHAHTYENDASGTTFYMPELDHDKDKYTHNTKPDGTEVFDGDNIVYTEIPTE